MPAKASHHGPTMMHETALVHYLIAETYYNCRSTGMEQAPLLQGFAASPLLYISDKG